METKRLAKAARKAADNSTYSQSNSFKTNRGKLKGNKSVLVVQLQGKPSSLKSGKIPAKHITEESVSESEVLLIQHEKYNTKKYNMKIPHVDLKVSIGE